MLIALAAQFFVSCAVVVFTFWSRSTGYREWYWAMAYNIPVNVLFAFVYAVILCLSRFDVPRSGDTLATSNKD